MHEVGISSLAILALLNTGMTPADPPIERGLTWLRKQSPSMTYEISLMIQALAAAKDKGDKSKVEASLLLGQGNKARVKVTTHVGSDKRVLRMVSNGMRMQLRLASGGKRCSLIGSQFQRHRLAHDSGLAVLFPGRLIDREHADVREDNLRDGALGLFGML